MERTRVGEAPQSEFVQGRRLPLTPADLSLPVRGKRASARLRGGEPLHMVIREMVEAKAQRRAS